MINSLYDPGHRPTFFEPDAFERQQHRDMKDPEWAEVRVYQQDEESVKEVLKESRDFDIVVKASGVGVFDELLEKGVLNNRRQGQRVIFWDVDAPATLSTIRNDPENNLKN